MKGPFELFSRSDCIVHCLGQLAIHGVQDWYHSGLPVRVDKHFEGRLYIEQPARSSRRLEAYCKIEMEVTKCVCLTVSLLLVCSLPVKSTIIEFEEFEDPGGSWGRQPIILSEGGYSNILVAIHWDVTESPLVIENIKVSIL